MIFLGKVVSWAELEVCSLCWEKDDLPWNFHGKRVQRFSNPKKNIKHFLLKFPIDVGISAW